MRVKAFDRSSQHHHSRTTEPLSIYSIWANSRARRSSPEIYQHMTIWAGRIWMKGGGGNKDTRVGVLNCSNRLLGSATTFMFYVLIYNAQCSFGNGSIMTVRVLKRLPRIRQKGSHPALVETRTSAPGFRAYGSHKSPHSLPLSLSSIYLTSPTSRHFPVTINLRSDPDEQSAMTAAQFESLV